MSDTIKRLAQPLFAMGQVVATRGFAALCEERGMDLKEAGIELILRHSLGDYGDVGASDQEANRWAIDNEARILSKYQFNGVGVYVITESDRSTTTVLLCDEY